MLKSKIGDLEVGSDLNIESITVKYVDGTEKVITKGAVVSMKENEAKGETSLNFEFMDFSGLDLTSLVYGVTEMGYKMGLFNDTEVEETEEDELQ